MNDRSDRDWDEVWRRWQPTREMWPPEKPVVELVRRLRRENRKRLHDLGCGTGRHLLLALTEGLDATGSDISPAAIAASRKNLKQAGVDASLELADMRSFSIDDGSLDALIAWDVIFHTTRSGMCDTVHVICAKLGDGGYFIGTFNTLEHPKYERTRAAKEAGKAKEEEPNTFVVPGGDGDTQVPHHYLTPDAMRDVLVGFRILEMAELTDTPGKWWFLAQKE